MVFEIHGFENLSRDGLLVSKFGTTPDKDGREAGLKRRCC